MDLLFNNIDSGNQLRHRVFNLDPGIHLQEIEIKLFIHQKLNGSCVGISNLFPDLYSRFAHFFPNFRSEGGGGRLFDDLLVPSLDGTFTLKQMDDIAVLVGQDLDLNMTRLLQILFDVNGLISKVSFCLACCSFECLFQFLFIPDDPHPFASATRCCLQQHRKTNLIFGFQQPLFVTCKTFCDWNTTLFCKSPGFNLVTHHLHRMGRGTNEDDPCFVAGFNK